MVWRLLPVLLLLGGIGSTSGEAPQLPIFDAHIHYSQSAWQSVTPEQALAILDQAGVQWALVSSTPDDGTLKLHKAAPQRMIPVLRPYRNRADMGSWHSDPEVQAYVESRLKHGVYKGIGEFHLSASNVAAPVVRRFAALAEAHALFLHAHVDDAAIEQMCHLYPKVRLLWAHAGMSASAKTVGRLVAQCNNLWVELALRFDVAPDGQLDPAWQALFLKHPDRFLIGTDTWLPERWSELVEEIETKRRWLAQLPREVAQQLAYQNGQRLLEAR
ncbi:MAG: amidohydrolase family protein [bacterium]|nr:amidohydrolase family protein [bacterium]